MRLPARKAMTDDSPMHWSVDKRVPLALIITILFQTGVAVWWASSITGRVATLENERAVEQVQRTSLGASIGTTSNDIATLKANVEAINRSIQTNADTTHESLNDLKRSIDTLTQQLLRRSTEGSNR